jgi:uncharacterized protein (DUF433 family)
MAVSIISDQPVLRVDEGGTIRIGASRVSLDSIVACHQRGDTPEQIAEGFPAVPIADIYSALGYYFRHRAAMDVYLAEQEKRAKEARRALEADPAHQEFSKTIKARIEARRPAP